MIPGPLSYRDFRETGPRTEEDPKGKPIWKAFSRSDLTDSQLNELFSSVNEVKVMSWLTYPHLYTPLNFHPESEIRRKIFVLQAESKLRDQKIDESAFRCSCRIRKSVKISL